MNSPIDRRTLRQITLVAAGKCPRCAAVNDRNGHFCIECNERINARNRQRYRPGRMSVRWTESFLARSRAVELRGWL